MNTSRDDDCTASLGSPFQRLTSLSEKKNFLMYNLNLPWCNLRPFPHPIASYVDEEANPTLPQPPFQA